jgi:hypothetical protein
MCPAKTRFGLKFGFISLQATTHYNKVFNRYHCVGYTQSTLNLHHLGAGLPSNLPASVVDARSLHFN